MGANPPLSAAEKQWLYRDAEPERRHKYLEKECEKYRKDLKSGRKKLINDLSQREKPRRHRKWRENYHTAPSYHQSKLHIHSQALPGLLYEMDPVPKTMC